MIINDFFIAHNLPKRKLTVEIGVFLSSVGFILKINGGKTPAATTELHASPYSLLWDI